MHNITARSWTSLSMHRTNRSWTWRYCPLSNCFFIGLMLLGYKFRLFQSLDNSSIYVNILIIEMTTQLTSKINGRFCFPRHILNASFHLFSRISDDQKQNQPLFLSSSWKNWFGSQKTMITAPTLLPEVNEGVTSQRRQMS